MERLLWLRFHEAVTAFYFLFLFQRWPRFTLLGPAQATGRVGPTPRRPRQDCGQTSDFAGAQIFAGRRRLPPCGRRCSRVQRAPASGPDIRGPSPAPAAAQGRSAHRSPLSGSFGMLLRHGSASRQTTGVDERSAHGQIVVNLAETRPSARCASGCARHPRTVPVPVAAACSLRRESE